MTGGHLHSYYELYYLQSGERYYFIEDRIYHIKKGTLVIIDSNQIHHTTTATNPVHERILIQLNQHIFTKENAILGKISVPDFFANHYGAITFNDEQQIYIERLLNKMLLENKHKDTGYETILLAKLSELFVTASRVMLGDNPDYQPDWTQSKKHTKIHEVVQYIQNNYSTEIILDDLADNVYMSKYYLSRTFKEITGLTIVEYINFNRIQHAKNLLENSNINITEIANTVGFNNVSYFQKVFRDHEKTTPLTYRKTFKNSFNHLSQ